MRRAMPLLFLALAAFAHTGKQPKPLTNERVPSILHCNYSPWKRPSPLCHLDRSEAKWRDLCVDAFSWKMFFDRAGEAG
jgi:hypothetical protein